MPASMVTLVFVSGTRSQPPGLGAPGPASRAAPKRVSPFVIPSEAMRWTPPRLDRHRGAKVGETGCESREEESVSESSVIGVDLAKSVFEIAVSRQPGRISERHRLSRAR